MIFICFNKWDPHPQPKEVKTRVESRVYIRYVLIDNIEYLRN